MEAATPNPGHLLSVHIVLGASSASFPLKCQELEDEANPGGSGVLGGTQYPISTSITISPLEDLTKKKKIWKASRDKLLCWCCYGDSNGFYHKGLLPLGKSGLSAMPILGDV